MATERPANGLQNPVIDDHGDNMSDTSTPDQNHDDENRYGQHEEGGSVFICGWVENRAETAHTARIRTGGTVPARNRRIKLGRCNRRYD